MSTAAGHLGLVVALMSPVLIGRWYGRAEGRRLGLTFVALAVTVVLLQAVVGRPRPEGLDYRIFGVPFYSFPSGHAALAFAAATYAAVAARSWVAVLWWLPAVLVAASRVTAGVHFPTDVVAGSALGAGYALTGYGFGRQQWERPSWTWLGFAWMGAVVTMAAFASAGLANVHEFLFVEADKLLHFVFFGFIGMFAVGWFAKTPPWRTLTVVVALTLLDENLQAAMPGRTVDPLDALMSVLGVLVFGGAVAIGLAGRSRAQSATGLAGVMPDRNTETAL